MDLQVAELVKALIYMTEMKFGSPDLVVQIYLVSGITLAAAVRCYNNVWFIYRSFLTVALCDI